MSVGPSEDPSERAVAVLTEALTSGTLDQIGDRLIYGNPSGIRTLQELEELKALTLRIQAETRHKTEENRHKTERLEEELKSLKGRVEILTAASEGYMDIRARFIDVYKRDRHDETPRPVARSIIQAGNIAAHHGDAVGDALLYERRKRTDERVYIELYGFPPGAVLRISKSSLKAILER